MDVPTDAELNAIGVLKRRTIEARVIAPLVAAFADEFGRERTMAVAQRVIRAIAREQGADLARAVGGDSLGHLEGTLDRWRADDALELEVTRSTEDVFEYDVTRCRYAEMYRALGIPELGAILSCQRDGALIEGFNPDVTLTRTQTIMGGATSCDFRYRLTRRGKEGEAMR